MRIIGWQIRDQDGDSSPVGEMDDHFSYEFCRDWLEQNEGEGRGWHLKPVFAEDFEDDDAKS